MALKRMHSKRKKGNRKTVTGTAKKRQLGVGMGTLYTGVPNRTYNADASRR